MKTIITSFKVLLLFTVITGVIYPLLITVFAQLCFPFKANGSLIRSGNSIVGSSLIGQQFGSVVYFWSRPSATNYNTLPSGGSNMAITSKKLKELVDSRKIKFIQSNALDSNTLVPSEMVFASASGLDPHISPAAALMQVSRISRARKLTSVQNKMMVQLVNNLIEKPQFSILGEPRVNVLLLNLKLDELTTKHNK